MLHRRSVDFTQFRTNYGRGNCESLASGNFSRALTKRTITQLIDDM